MHSIILLNKPYLLSSFKAANQAASIFGKVKFGHGGSLDPAATGMLPICFGESRKFSSYLLDADKCYTVEAHMGLVTTTGDLEGEIITKSLRNISFQEIELAISRFHGSIKQVPPMYSALKHEGVALYHYARRGINIERKFREIIISEFKILSWQPPLLKCFVRCSKGTYIRSLLNDVAVSLGMSGATLINLHRNWVEPFQNEYSITLEELSYLMSNNIKYSNVFKSIDDLFKDNSNRYDLTQKQAVDLTKGRKVFLQDLSQGKGLVKLFTEDKFLGIAYLQTDGMLVVKKFQLI